MINIDLFLVKYVRHFQVSLVGDGRHGGHLHPLLGGRDLQVSPGRGQPTQPLPASLSASAVPAVPPLPGRQQEVVVVVGGHEVEVGLCVRPREDPLECPRLGELLL